MQGKWYIDRCFHLQKWAKLFGIFKWIDSIIAFGDDYADIGMLELCGTGVAMGNAIDEVKERADIVIGSNDEDGIAGFIENEIL